jgi:hypothetical protein
MTEMVLFLELGRYVKYVDMTWVELAMESKNSTLIYF